MSSDLLNLCWQARSFLEPRWLSLHQSWGDPLPETPSKYMCRYTSIFLKTILSSQTGLDWQIVGGRPAKADEGTAQGCFGFRTADGFFFDHCWVQSIDQIVDITAEQFGGEAVIITTVNDPRYVSNLEEADLAQALTKLAHRSEPWVRAWNQQYGGDTVSRSGHPVGF